MDDVYEARPNCLGILGNNGKGPSGSVPAEVAQVDRSQLLSNNNFTS